VTSTPPADAEFDALQRKLVPLWRSIDHINADPQTIVVVPSITDATGDRDGLPNVVLEAMSSGRPVIASDVGAVSSAVVDGRTGVLVPPADAEALAGALEFLVDQPDCRERLGREARARVERDFELHTCTTRLRHFLETVYA